MFKKSKGEKKDLKSKLTPIQFHVTQEDGTEPPYHNEYWDNEAEGIYVDIISNEVLFSSLDKYDAGCGWPSFTKPLTDLVNKSDGRYGMRRIEVRSQSSDAHLGHVFDDGPEDQGGLRYCINSAALRFIPKEDMKKEGFEAYLKLFNKTE